MTRIISVRIHLETKLCCCTRISHSFFPTGMVAKPSPSYIYTLLLLLLATRFDTQSITYMKSTLQYTLSIF